MDFPIPTEIIKQIISDYNYNEQNNIQHKGLIKMNNNNNNNNNNNTEENEQPATWISKTKSGKGFIIYVGEKPNQTVLVGSIALLSKFVNEKIKGVPLSEIKH